MASRGGGGSEALEEALESSGSALVLTSRRLDGEMDGRMMEEEKVGWMDAVAPSSNQRAPIF